MSAFSEADVVLLRLAYAVLRRQAWVERYDAEYDDRRYSWHIGLDGDILHQARPSLATYHVRISGEVGLREIREVDFAGLMDDGTFEYAEREMLRWCELAQKREGK